MSMEPQLFALEMVTEMTERLAPVVLEVLKLLKEKTATPDEALIVLETTARTLINLDGIALVDQLTPNRSATRESRLVEKGSHEHITENDGGSNVVSGRQKIRSASGAKSQDRSDTENSLRGGQGQPPPCMRFFESNHHTEPAKRNLPALLASDEISSDDQGAPEEVTQRFTPPGPANRPPGNGKNVTENL